MPRKKVVISVYLEPEQDQALHVLSRHAKVPMADLVREGVNMVLAKYHQGKKSAAPVPVYDRSDIEPRYDPPSLYLPFRTKP
jgi:hypothetical protein